MSQNNTRASLLVRVRQMEEVAWQEFFEVYTPLIYGYVLRRGIQVAEAEDLTQETLVEIVRCIRNFEYQPEKGRFRDWLGCVVRRKVIHFWRKTRPMVLGVDQNETGAVDALWSDQFQVSILQSALQNVQGLFAERTWQAFLLTWKEDQPASQVAQQLSMPIEAVYNAKSRVLKQLEEEVLRLSDDSNWKSN